METPAFSPPASVLAGNKGGVAKIDADPGERDQAYVKLEQRLDTLRSHACPGAK